jgi:hypothetical protein
MPVGNNRPGAGHAVLKNRVLFPLKGAQLTFSFFAAVAGRFVGGHFSFCGTLHIDLMNHSLLSNMYAMKCYIDKKSIIST